MDAAAPPRVGRMRNLFHTGRQFCPGRKAPPQTTLLGTPFPFFFLGSRVYGGRTSPCASQDLPTCFLPLSLCHLNHDQCRAWPERSHLLAGMRGPYSRRGNPTPLPAPPHCRVREIHTSIPQDGDLDGRALQAAMRHRQTTGLEVEEEFLAADEMHGASLRDLCQTRNKYGGALLCLLYAHNFTLLPLLWA